MVKPFEGGGSSQSSELLKVSQSRMALDEKLLNAIERQSKLMEKSTKGRNQMTRAMRRMSDRLKLTALSFPKTAIFAALGIGLAALAHSLANSSVSTQYLAKSLSTNRKELQALRFGFKQLGAPKESADALVRAIEEARIDPRKMGALATLGVRGLKRDPTEIASDVLEKLSDAQLPAVVRRQAMGDLGLDIGSFGQFLKESGDAHQRLTKQIDNYRKRTRVVSDKTVQDLNKMRQSFNLFTETLGNQMATFMGALAPAQTAFFNVMQETIAQIDLKGFADPLNRLLTDENIRNAVESVIEFSKNLFEAMQANSKYISPILKMVRIKVPSPEKRQTASKYISSILKMVGITRPSPEKRQAAEKMATEQIRREQPKLRMREQSLLIEHRKRVILSGEETAPSASKATNIQVNNYGADTNTVNADQNIGFFEMLGKLVK